MTGDAAVILIVEDEPPIRRLLRATLGANDYRTLEAATGAEALSAMRHHRPDLVLLDLGLPDVDGLALIGKIRGLGPVPIVVLSSRGDEAAKVAALDSGADDYDTKPFGADELLARIRAALRHRLQQQGAERQFASDDLSVDLVRRLVRRAPATSSSRPRNTTSSAAQIHAGKVLTTSTCCAKCGATRRSIRNISVYVRQLRQKIEGPFHAAARADRARIGYRLV